MIVDVEIGDAVEMPIERSHPSHDDDKRNFKNVKIWSNHKCYSIKGKSGLKCLGKNGGNGNGGGVNFGGCWRSKGKDHQ